MKKIGFKPPPLFERRFRYFLLLLREFEVMSMVDIEKYLEFKNPNERTSFLRAVRIKSDEIQKYKAKYVNDRGVHKRKDIYYLGDMTDQKLMLIGKRYTKD